jgi:hypothetical protein
MQPYTVQTAMLALSEKIVGIKIADLAEDLLPLFEQRFFIEAWLEGFKVNFQDFSKLYI